MNLPNWVILFFSDFFNGSQVKIIANNWYRYTQCSLSNSSREELLSQARMILSFSKI